MSLYSCYLDDAHVAFIWPIHAFGLAHPSCRHASIACEHSPRPALSGDAPTDYVGGGPRLTRNNMRGIGGSTTYQLHNHPAWPVYQIFLDDFAKRHCGRGRRRTKRPILDSKGRQARVLAIKQTRSTTVEKKRPGQCCGDYELEAEDCMQQRLGHLNRNRGWELQLKEAAKG
jgi:hypothetical protein